MLIKKCPYCGEEIKAEAIKCKHCGEFLQNRIIVEEDNSRSSNMYRKVQQTRNWYDKKWIVLLLCLFFLPVGIYGLWKGTSLNGWKFFFSIFFGYLTVFILSIGLFCLGDYLSKKENSSFLNVVDDQRYNENAVIKFTANTQSDGEDFNSFINQYISDSIFQKERTLKPYIYTTGIGDDQTRTYEMDLYFMTNENIFEGEKAFDGYIMMGVFKVVSLNEIRYCSSVPETDNGTVITFKLIQNKWMLVEYSIS